MNCLYRYVSFLCDTELLNEPTGLREELGISVTEIQRIHNTELQVYPRLLGFIVEAEQI
jgi:hypothetical protein